jgi:two-component system CitB family response regulator/two-component system response regulator DcuR
MDLVRVLIVEDDERISEIHRRFTQKVSGFEVVGIANSILEGKEMCDILDPDLILLDLYFPDGYGIDLLRQIRSRHQEVDLILITAAKEVTPLKEAIRGGVFDYIIKPVVFSRFRESMEKYLEYRRRIEEGDTLEQREVDFLLGTSSISSANKNDLPKGIDPLTLQKVRGIFEDMPAAGLSAEEAGASIGVSRTTARRYLEYLVSGGYLTADLVYRKVGRPERKYFRLNSI